jgi:hypothetical protein
LIAEEIRAFDPLGEYERFCAHIEGQVASGLVRERIPDPSYEKGKILVDVGSKNLETQEIWGLVPPDFPFRGLWKRVDI